MAQQHLTTLIASSGWMMAVTRRASDYYCWVITPELATLSDGETYTTSQDALDAARSLVYCTIGPQVDFSRCRLYD
ncbi:hypothetical protein [Nodosilinea nodulosa]|uniref:hypothetical protein n=1 Tax=Nodosilinea nodulosa TaxID=416001 RepID=UPI0002F3D687|nr:hypothetical protein [Nodosilinea nodulosa]